MNGKRIVSRRLLSVVWWILVWLIVWNSIFAVATGQMLVGAIGGVVGLAMIGVGVDGRVIRKLEGRELPNLSLLMFSLIIVVLIYGEVRDLMINELEFLGEFYLPGLISLVRIIGSFVLAALLIWESVKLLRQPSQ